MRRPTLAAVDGRSPVLLGLSWRVQALQNSIGDGRRITGSKGCGKAMLAANFRVNGLPFGGAGITRVGLPLLRRIDAGTDPQRPGPLVGTLALGELTLGVGGRSRDKALAWVQQLLDGGGLDDAERLDLGVEMLGATLKTVLATVQLKTYNLLACDEPVIEAASDVLPGLTLRLAVAAVALKFSNG